MAATGRQDKPNTTTGDIAAAVRALIVPRGVVEVRIPDFPKPKSTTAGYFDEAGKLAELVARYNGRTGGVYVTLNEVNPALLARYNNRLVEYAKQTTSDADVTRRRFLPLDFDPRRPAGIPSTEAEHGAALDRADECRRWLASKGWPSPVEIDSGNGAYLLYLIDLPNDDAARELIKTCLLALDWQFSDDMVSLDTSMFNAARIIRLCGTTNRKGDGTPDRPHRTARLLTVPDPRVKVPRDCLEGLAAMLPQEPKRDPVRNGHMFTESGFDLARWITDHGLDVAFDGPWNGGGHRWILETCPWNEDHTNRSAYILRLPNGAISAGCHHNGCQGKGWRDLRGMYEPGYQQRRERAESARTSTSGSGGSVGSGDAPPETKRPAPEPYQPFPTDCLPGVVARFVREAAAAIGCDEGFVAMPALAACAGMIGYTRVLRIKRTWTAPAVVWGCVVAESGGHKTPAMNLALQPVFALHRQLIAEHDANLAAFEVAREGWLQRRNQYRRQHRDDNPPAEPFDEPEPARPRQRRVHADNVTIERLASLLDDNQRGLLVYREELNAWLCSFTRYSKTSDLPQWLSAHAAGPVMIDRNGRDPRTGERQHLYVDHAAISVVGSIQPGVLARALTQEHRDAGLSARLLLCYPPQRQKEWTEAEVDSRTLEDYANLLGALAELQFAPGDEPNRPIVLQLDSYAKDEWVRYFGEWADRQAAAEGEHRSVLSKLEEGAARFALIHAVANAASWGDDPTAPTQVRASDMEAGVKLARWFAQEWVRVQHLLVEDETAKATRRLVDLLRSWGGRATVAQLQRANTTRYRTAADAETALQSLVDDGVAAWADRPTTDKGGRPTRECVLVSEAD
jgi:hypothetical protein